MSRQVRRVMENSQDFDDRLINRTVLDEMSAATPPARDVKDAFKMFLIRNYPVTVTHYL